MEVRSVLCMNGGEGDVSYARNSFASRKALSMTRPLLDKTIEDFLGRTRRREDCSDPRVFVMADLGCSSGPNTMSVVSAVAGVLRKFLGEPARSRPPQIELQAFLNDLPGNDFNSIFRSFPANPKACEGDNNDDNVPCYVSGVPGSFYGRLFPTRSLHFVHASYSVHWLTKVPTGVRDERGAPLNKGRIYISRSSPPLVWQAYLEQFREDFTLFLRHRAEEMVEDGRMLLVLRSREGSDPTSKEAVVPWEILAEALSALVSEGLVEEEKLDSFDIPYYAASPHELHEVVLREGSFTVDDMKSFAFDFAEDDDGGKNIFAEAEKAAKNVRCTSESIISHHFGPVIMDRLYEKLTLLLVELMSKEAIKLVNVVIVLRRKA